MSVKQGSAGPGFVNQDRDWDISLIGEGEDVMEEKEEEKYLGDVISKVAGTSKIYKQESIKALAL